MKIPLLPLLALAGAVFASFSVVRAARPTQVAPAAAEPPRSPFEGTIAGSGIVEPAGQNVAIGTALSGLVLEVAVRHGQNVKAGELLFRVDDRELAAKVQVREAALLASRAELSRLQALPRAEDREPLLAALAAVQAEFDDAKAQWDMADSVTDKRALSAELLARRKFQVAGAQARVASAKAQITRLEAGAWEPDLALAKARIAGEEAALHEAQTALLRASVRAPSDGTVLQINVRVGEFASAASPTPWIVLGDLSHLVVRVDIDENDAWRFREGARAHAFVRGNRDIKAALEFVRVEPYVVPKRSLTGDSTERVDTRVLQALYRFDPKLMSVYVGQQVDVFVEVTPDGGAK